MDEKPMFFASARINAGSARFCSVRSSNVVTVDRSALCAGSPYPSLYALAAPASRRPATDAWNGRCKVGDVRNCEVATAARHGANGRAALSFVRDMRGMALVAALRRASIVDEAMER
jgi:hypothetical protein